MNAIDLGFRVKQAISLESIHIFVPFSVDKDDITDLGFMLDDADIAIAIFNENAKVTKTSENRSTFYIEFGSTKLSCWKLQPDSELKFENVTNSGANAGTIITFEPEVFAVNSDVDERYVRLRINLSSDAEKAFFTRYRPPDRPFLSGFDEIEVVDFRFNEARNLPRNVIGRMNDELRISEINYFVIRDITDGLNLSHSTLKKCRTLESPVWTKYVHGGQDKKETLRNAIIFYWQKLGKEGGSIRDYNALARFQRRKTGRRAIFGFLFTTLVMGIVAGLVSGWLVTDATRARAAPRQGTDQSTAHQEPKPRKPKSQPKSTQQQTESG